MASCGSRVRRCYLRYLRHAADPHCIAEVVHNLRDAEEEEAAEQPATPTRATASRSAVSIGGSVGAVVGSLACVPLDLGFRGVEKLTSTPAVPRANERTEYASSCAAFLLANPKLTKRRARCRTQTRLAFGGRRRRRRRRLRGAGGYARSAGCRYGTSNSAAQESSHPVLTRIDEPVRACTSR